MIKTNVKVRGSTNGISNKYSINSYYSTGNHTQGLFNINLDSPFNKQSIKSEQDNKYKTCYYQTLKSMLSLYYTYSYTISVTFSPWHNKLS
jgi:hypothetical protein